MQKVRIPKKSGGSRLIYKPNEAEKKVLRKVLPLLHAHQRVSCPPLIVHGFWPGRSPVTNALQHVGYRHSVSFDLACFFDGVSKQQAIEGLHPTYLTSWSANGILELCFIDGAPRQGLPTSPVVSNIAAAPMDRKLLAIKDTAGWFAYTRYADDLTFSTNDRDAVDILLREVPLVVAGCGFTINARKTRVQHALWGRRRITGVAVDANGIYPTRKLKRRLRAARHQGNDSAAQGLSEWAKLKAPREYSYEVSRNQAEFDKEHAATTPWT